MNSFEALAVLASKERWCWSLRCTTCGHTHFKYAFRELAAGKTPQGSDWIIRKQRTRYRDELGPLPKRYSSKEKERIIEACIAASLSTISAKCTFPDWLGYMGLVLHHMRSSSPSYQTLSVSWAEQLVEMVAPESDIGIRLKEVAEGGSTLSLGDLQGMEKYLNHHPI